MSSFRVCVVVVALFVLLTLAVMVAPPEAGVALLFWLCCLCRS